MLIMEGQGCFRHFWFCKLCSYMKDLDFNKLFQCIMKPYTMQCDIFHTFLIVVLYASSEFNFGNLSPAMQLYQVPTATIFN